MRDSATLLLLRSSLGYSLGEGTSVYSKDNLDLTVAPVTEVTTSTTEKAVSLDNHADMPSTSGLQAFSAHLSKGSTGQQKNGTGVAISNVACCARSIFSLHSGMESPLEVQTAGNVSEAEQTTGHEDLCCDEQIVELLKNVSTIFIICSTGTIHDLSYITESINLQNAIDACTQRISSCIL